MAVAKKKSVMGQEATTENGAEWSWTRDGYTYRWSGRGLIYRSVADDGQGILVAAAKTVDIAIAYTVGYCDGFDGACAKAKEEQK